MVSRGRAKKWLEHGCSEQCLDWDYKEYFSGHAEHVLSLPAEVWKLKMFC